MGTVDVDAPTPKEAPRSYQWSVTLYGEADSPEAARKAARAVVDTASDEGLQSGSAIAPGLRAELNEAGIIDRPLPPDPTSEAAVRGNGLVKNTPLNAKGLPDPKRVPKTATADKGTSGSGSRG